MSSNRDQYADEVYHGEDDPYDERPAEAREDESAIPYLPVAPWGWWPSLGRRSHEEGRYGEDAHEGAGTYERSAHEEDATERGGVWRLWDESLITLLIVGGAVLFLFPEPATSGLGILLMGLGVLAWFVDWAT